MPAGLHVEVGKITGLQEDAATIYRWAGEAFHDFGQGGQTRAANAMAGLFEPFAMCRDTGHRNPARQIREY